MLKKILITFTLITSLTISWYIFFKDNTEKNQVDTWETTVSPLILEENTIKNSQDSEIAWDIHLSKSEKIERASILVKKADYLTVNNQYQEASDIYERILLLDPSPEIEKKTAYTSFMSKNFQRSADLYKKFSGDLFQSEKEALLHSLRYTGDGEYLTILENISLPIAVKDALKVSWKCEFEYISCEQTIREYPHDSITINELKKALNNYENLGYDDHDYKEALLIGAFYKNQDYTTAIRISENLLRRKTDYRPIIKIAWFSSFMIGQYERAKWLLSRYKKLEPKDPEADFILGLIFFSREDFETSNIYFNKAILGGYKPKITVERKLAYNYHKLWLTKNMFQVLGYLMLEPSATESDMENAIYLALLNDEIRIADNWIKNGLIKYPESENILSLQAWYLRLTKKTDEANAIVDSILLKNKNNIIALIQWGIIAQERWQNEKAKDLFKRAKIVDAGGSWEEVISDYLWEL